MSETKTLRGKALLRAAVNHIVQHPEKWNQKQYHCGTSHCIAGWCQVLAGLPLEESTSVLVREVGLSDAEASWLASGFRRLGEIHGFAKAFIAGESYFDRAGRDRAGFDRDGRDRAGFDRAGFDRDGRDRDGFDRAGFDRDGRDRDGFDRAGRDRDGRDGDGFDRFGRDRAGFDRAGFDRAGFDRAGRDHDGFDRDGNGLPLLEEAA